MTDWKKIKLQKEKNVADVMSAFTKCCSICSVSSSKRKLFNLESGLVCLGCLPEGMTGMMAAQEEEKLAEHLKKEANKPKPEGYGGWS